jgi:hypothetical protein
MSEPDFPFPTEAVYGEEDLVKGEVRERVD